MGKAKRAHRGICHHIGKKTEPSGPVFHWYWIIEHPRWARRMAPLPILRVMDAWRVEWAKQGVPIVAFATIQREQLVGWAKQGVPIVALDRGNSG
jgi:hypothetical protein